MDYKPADLLIGVTDIFAILLPGAIVVAIGYPYVQPMLESSGVLPVFYGDAERWIMFLVSAYLAGHVLFLIGAALDEAVYDPLRRRIKPRGNDTTYAAATKVMDTRLKGVAHKMNTYQWARGVLRVELPSALAEIDRYEADSKFFRSLYLMLLSLLIIVLWYSRRTCRVGWICSSTTAVVLAAAIPITMVAAMLIRLLRTAKGHDEQRNDPDAFWYLLAALNIGLVAIIVTHENWVALSLWALVGLSIWRYADRRWKSTKTAYQHVLVLDRPGRATRRTADDTGVYPEW